MFSLDHSAPERATVIDATFKGNMARYLNHSCSVNIWLFSQTVGGRSVVLVSSQSL